MAGTSPRPRHPAATAQASTSRTPTDATGTSSPPARSSEPFWSPDSTALAYAFDQHGRWTAVVNVRTGARRVITRGEPLAWSPSGKNLAILRDNASPTTTIVAVPATGGRPRPLFKVPPATP
jgi:hypothetical protein